MDIHFALVVGISINIFASCIISLIAREKGYGEGEVCGWFLYALFLWPVALVHILIRQTRESQQAMAEAVKAGVEQALKQKDTSASVEPEKERARKLMAEMGDEGT